MAEMDADLTAARWDEEYRKGRYAAEPPLPFVARVLSTLERRPPRAGDRGLYVGCGNGRNFLPLVDAGLNLYGLDLSREALSILADRRPSVASRLICGDFGHLQSPPRSFGYLVAIQVFQHGTASDGEVYFRKSAELLQPGGLLCVRVNSVKTQIYYRHTVIETTALGGLTVRYGEGPKRGLLVHFYSQAELDALTRDAFRLLAEPHEEIIVRSPPKTGHWAQWEMIWERR
jgi:2-polyprenyl-3-methyl-5-hydroxy-6-metoxy-1,4-benzoquinol methylase